ncbi:MAG: Ig-like domain-containing protein [Imperialibacter sp.]|uniref:Ig-like domain-containing protein n=1 Tax=Imperialibacter sp. TaxID=2038411 RepID=UPI003A88BA24
MKNALLCAITTTVILGNYKALCIDRTVKSGNEGHHEWVNTAPVSSYYYFTTQVNSTLSTSAEDGLLSKASDEENDPLSIEITLQPAHGTLLVEEDGSFTYSPEADYFGKDLFKYKVNDGADDSNESNVFLTILTSPRNQRLSQVEWTNNYGSGYEDDITSLIQSNSSEILMGGLTTSDNEGVPGNDDGKDKFWALKINGLGQVEWEKKYNITEQSSICCIVTLPDNSYLMAGNSRNTGDILLIKTNENGDLIWEESYGGSKKDEVADIMHLPDEGFLLVGSTESSDGDIQSGNLGSSDGWLIKTDLSGNILWEKTYGGNRTDRLFAVETNCCNGFVVSGWSSSFSANAKEDYWILNVDSNGDVLWEKNFGGSEYDILKKMKTLANGNIVLAGNTLSQGGDIQSNTHGQNDIWLIAINQDGEIQWERAYGGSNSEIIKQLHIKGSGNMILSGMTDSWDFDVQSNSNRRSDNYWIVEVSPNGEILWEQSYSSDKSGISQLSTSLLIDETSILLAGFSDIGPTTFVVRIALNSLPELASNGISIVESEQISTELTALSAYDLDNDPLTISIQSGNTDEAFQLSTDGVLTLAKELDFETTATYNLTIEVSDGKHSSTAVLTINIEDVNEAPTDIEVSALEVSENLEANTLLGLLTSADQDGDDTHFYTLVEGEGAEDNASFTVDADQLLTAETFDFETKSSFNIRLQTEDAEGATFSKAVTITVADVNEAPTNISLSSSGFAENSALNTVIGSFSTTDPDLEDSFAYSLSDNEEMPENQLFLIDGDQLLVNNAFDFEERSSFEIEVTSTDAAENVLRKKFNITLTDVNEPPVANSSTSETFEDTAVSGILTGSDPEKGNLSFSVVENPSHGSVSVDGTSGAFTYTPSPNFNGSDSFTFLVGDSELTSDAATVTLAIASVNDAPTDVTMAPISVTNTGGPLQIGLALASTDVDADTFTYSKAAGEGDGDNALFDLVGGTLYTNSSAFLNKENNFSVRLATTDAAGASFEKQFVIGIDYCNNTVSASGGSSSSLTVPVFSGQEIALVTNDSNTGKNKVVWQKGAGYNIEKYNIYKEGSNEDVYSLTGFVTSGEPLEFIDNESDAAVKSFKYKLTVVDQCGAESGLSDFHKTIHLTSSLGIDNDVNLIWNQYIGISYSSVELYKREGEGEWQLLEALSSSTTSYTDKNYSNTVNTSYRVDVVLLQPVSLGRILETYSRISSNVLDIESTVLGTDSELDEIEIFPNPTSGLLQFKTIAFSSEVSIVDLAGSVLRRVTIGQNATIDIADLKPGVYLIRIDGMKTKTFRVIKH